jgi:hypothetical protein
MQPSRNIPWLVTLLALYLFAAEAQGVESPADAPPLTEARLLLPFDDGSEFGGEAPTRAAVFESSRVVRPNIDGLASNPGAVVVPDSVDSGDFSLPVVDFEAHEGFIIDDDGNVVTRRRSCGVVVLDSRATRQQ